MEVVAFELLVESNPYINPLGEMVLQEVSPILLGDERPFELFFISIKPKDRNSSKYNMLALFTCLQYTYICHDGSKINVRFLNGETINDVLQLYYGAVEVDLEDAMVIAVDVGMKAASERVVVAT